MPFRDPKSAPADLLSLMTDASGSVLPHEHSAFQKADPPTSVLSKTALVDVVDRDANDKSAASAQPIAEATRRDSDDNEARQVVLRQAARRRTRRSDRTAPASQKGGGTTAVAPNYPPGSPLAGEEKYLRVKQVARRFSVAVATIWRWSTDSSDFPKPVRPGPGATRWLLVELEAFEAKLRERR